MKTVLVYLKRGQSSLEEAVYLEEKFSYKALIFNVIWLVVNRLWIQFFVFSIVSVSILQLVENNIVTPAVAIGYFIIMSIYLGLSYSDYMRYKLERNQYELKDIIVANSVDEAKYKFLNKSLA